MPCSFKLINKDIYLGNFDTFLLRYFTYHNKHILFSVYFTATFSVITASDFVFILPSR